MQHHFMDVDNITKVPQIEMGCDASGGDLMRTSPSEPLHALLFAAAKGLAEATAASQTDAVAAAQTICQWKNSAELADHSQSRRWRVGKILCICPSSH